jgi:hypothetical protein
MECLAYVTVTIKSYRYAYFFYLKTMLKDSLAELQNLNADTYQYLP